jgi:hypothetical protein
MYIFPAVEESYFSLRIVRVLAWVHRAMRFEALTAVPEDQVCCGVKKRESKKSEDCIEDGEETQRYDFYGVEDRSSYF